MGHVSISDYLQNSKGVEREVNFYLNKNEEEEEEGDRSR